ncbi:MAG TPA: hypothetical protein VID27_01035, partial [Blastocatellia bacterium]
MDSAHRVLRSFRRSAPMRVERTITALLLALFVAARLWWLTRFGLYGDEIFSLRLAAGSWSDLVANVIRDA